MNVYYTLEEVAFFLNKTPEWLLKQMREPDEAFGSVGAFITPSVHFETPLLLISRSGKEHYVQGWFDLLGMHEPGAFNGEEMLYPSLEQGGSRYRQLHQDGKVYRPKKCLTIWKGDFRIAQKELASFAKSTGRRLKLPLHRASLPDAGTAGKFRLPGIGATSPTAVYPHSSTIGAAGGEISEFYTIAEAAEVLHTSQERIFILLGQEKLTACVLIKYKPFSVCDYAEIKWRCENDTEPRHDFVLHGDFYTSPPKPLKTLQEILDEPVKFYKKDLVITKEEMERYKQTIISEVATPKTKCNLPDRASIPTKGHGPITKVIEHIFEKYNVTAPEVVAPGNQKLFLEQIKKELKTGARLANGELISNLVDRVVQGAKPCVVMVNPKEGAKSGTEEDYKFYSAALSSRISAVRKKYKP